MTASLNSKWAKKESGETAALFRAASAPRSSFCQDRPPRASQHFMVNHPVTIEAHGPARGRGVGTMRDAIDGMMVVRAELNDRLDSLQQAMARAGVRDLSQRIDG